jgi:OmpA-OmpF porin, OOP family
MSLLFLLPAALAQAVSGGEAPPINAQNYRPPIDAERTLWTQDPGLFPDGYYGGRLWLHHTWEPLVYQTENADGSVTTDPLVENILQADAIGYVAFRRMRFGVDLPIYLWSAGTAVERGTGIGDIVVDLKGTVVDPAENPVGVALSGRLLLPTASVVAPLGQASTGAELELAVGHSGEKLLWAANLGARFAQTQELENVTIDDAFLWRGGVGYSLSETAGLSFDLTGQSQLGSFSNSAGTPIEALVGGWKRAGDLVVRGGVGTGLTAGIGAPQLRTMIAVGWEPPRVGDRDGDGVKDDVDACVEVAEDLDGYADADGCPESVQVFVIFQDPAGELLAPQAIRAECNGKVFEGQGELQMALDPTDCAVTASLDGYEPLAGRFTVPAGTSHQVVQVMKALAGTIVLKVVDPAGAPVPNPSWTIEKGDTFRPVPGDGRLTVPPGSYVIRVQAPGYRAARKEVAVQARTEVVVELMMPPTKVEVTKERIDLREKVFFDTGKASIQPASFAMLDEVADVLRDHPEILLVSIEGHTDSRGSNSANKKLSDARAASVRQYLVDKGVEPNRLSSVGYGEEKPLDPRNVAEAWEKNRRVDIVIQKRAD